FFGLAWALAPLRIDLPGGARDDFQVGAWALIVIMVAFALKALRLTHGKIAPWAGSISLATAAVWFAPDQLWWLPLSVGVGAAVHILGDMLTIQGVPLLWPLRPTPPVETPMWKNNGHFALPLLGNAGSIREWVLVMVLNAYIVYVLGATFGLW
ncbi:MAG TPA: metal-dependent hydrolase, partial [Beutenbergiaceae bacterium]|nr:metal-dependent hydrolase [Beutenbergiaceae bacterium]